MNDNLFFQKKRKTTELTKQKIPFSSEFRGRMYFQQNKVEQKNSELALRDAADVALFFQELFSPYNAVVERLSVLFLHNEIGHL
jgi:hypothetical protein